MITLTRLAYASSTCVKVILDNFALETAWEVVKKFPQCYANHVIENISLLLAAVCRANNLSADQVISWSLSISRFPVELFYINPIGT